MKMIISKLTKYITLGDLLHHSPMKGDTSRNRVSENPITAINFAISAVSKANISLRMIGRSSEKFVSTQAAMDNPNIIFRNIGSFRSVRSKKSTNF